MDNLPYELIEMIFEKLDFKDLGKLRLVNKKFKNIISGFKYLDDNGIENKVNGIKIDQLILDNSKDDRFVNFKWFESKFELNDKNIIKFNDYFSGQFKSILLNTPTVNLFKLKRLKIILGSSEDMSFINRFTNLVHLDFCSVFYFNFDLKLENLKILKIKGFEERAIDCPKLESLCCSYFFYKRNKFLFPESIRYLDTELYAEKSVQFTNLDTLIIQEIYEFSHEILLESIFKENSKIKNIHFYYNSKLFTSKFDYCNGIKLLINKLLEERNKLKSNLPNIYIDHQLIRNQNHLNDLINIYSNKN